jgi:hypothetical protein
MRPEPIHLSNLESLTASPNARSSSTFRRTPTPLRPRSVSWFSVASTAFTEKSDGHARPASRASSSASGESTAPRSTIVRSGLVTGIRFRTVVCSVRRSPERWTIVPLGLGPFERGTLISTMSFDGSINFQTRAAALWDAAASGPAARQAASNDRSHEAGDPAKAKTPAWRRRIRPLRTPRRSASADTPHRAASAVVNTPYR